jgi:hypothetical protein
MDEHHKNALLRTGCIIHEPDGSNTPRSSRGRV